MRWAANPSGRAPGPDRHRTGRGVEGPVDRGRTPRRRRRATRAREFDGRCLRWARRRGDQGTRAWHRCPDVRADGTRRDALDERLRNDAARARGVAGFTWSRERARATWRPAAGSRASRGAIGAEYADPSRRRRRGLWGREGEQGEATTAGAPGTAGPAGALGLRGPEPGPELGEGASPSKQMVASGVGGGSRCVGRGTRAGASWKGWARARPRSGRSSEARHPRPRCSRPRGRFGGGERARALKVTPSSRSRPGLSACQASNGVTEPRRGRGKRVSSHLAGRDGPAGAGMLAALLKSPADGTPGATRSLDDGKRPSRWWWVGRHDLDLDPSPIWEIAEVRAGGKRCLHACGRRGRPRFSGRRQRRASGRGEGEGRDVPGLAAHGETDSIAMRFSPLPARPRGSADRYDPALPLSHVVGVSITDRLAFSARRRLSWWLNAQLNGLFTLTLALGYFWCAQDASMRRGHSDRRCS